MSFEMLKPSSATTFARLTGAMYLMFILASVVADTLGHVGLGSPSQIYTSITTSLSEFRVALALGFASTLFFLVAAWGLYVMLRSVDADVALLFLLLNAAGVAVQCASLLGLVWAMIQGDSSVALSGVSSAQAHSLALVGIDTYRTGFVAAQLFYGAWLFPLGYLIFRSHVLPRTLGVLLILDGVGELIWFVQGLLLPEHHTLTRPGTVVSFAAEVGLTLWLLIRGVNTGGSVVGQASTSPDAGHEASR